ncbi:MAG: pilus assembly protein [Dehalococcoidia bacterium]|nr:pilus assembly protein [Dehalococcoidia bacterium]
MDAALTAVGHLTRVGGRLRRLRESEKGQTLVEFALVLPFFLVLIFALVDFGRAYYTWQVVTNGAREGARAAAVQSDNATIDSKIYASFCTSYPSNCGLDTSKLTITKTNVQGARGTEVTVRLAYDFNWVTPMGNILTLIGGSSVAAPTISSTTSMRLE